MGDNSPNMQIERGNTYGFGVTADCVYGSLNSGFQSSATGTVVHATGGTGCELTTAWSINAAYEHYWTPQFHESFLFGIVQTKYSTQANNNLCMVENGLSQQLSRELVPAQEPPLSAAATTTGRSGRQGPECSTTSPRLSTWAWSSCISTWIQPLWGPAVPAITSLPTGADR